MSNRSLAFWFSFAAALFSESAILTHELGMFGPAVFAALLAIQYIALQICDAIKKSGKDTA